MKTQALTKWALFSVLLGTVAANLNWNPESTILARSGFGKAQLASEKITKNSEDEFEIGKSQLIEVKDGINAILTIDKKVTSNSEEKLLLNVKYSVTESGICEDCLNNKGIRSLEVTKSEYQNFDKLRVKLLSGLIDEKSIKEEKITKEEKKKSEKLVWLSNCDEEVDAETVNERYQARMDQMKCYEDEFVDKVKSCESEAKGLSDKAEKKKLQAACLVAAREFFNANMARPLQSAFSGQMGPYGIFQANQMRNSLLLLSGRYTEGFLASRLTHLSGQGLMSQANMLYQSSLQQGSNSQQSLSHAHTWLDYQSNPMIMGTQGNQLHSGLMRSAQFQDNFQAPSYMNSIFEQGFRAPIQQVTHPINSQNANTPNFAFPAYNENTSQNMFNQYVGGSGHVVSNGIPRSGARLAPVSRHYNPYMARTQTTPVTGYSTSATEYANPSYNAAPPSYVYGNNNTRTANVNR